MYDMTSLYDYYLMLRHELRKLLWECFGKPFSQIRFGRNESICLCMYLYYLLHKG